MARHFEQGASCFRAFVEKLEVDAESGEADEAPIVEEGTEGVWVMTVHKGQGPGIPSGYPRRSDLQRNPWPRAVVRPRPAPSGARRCRSPDVRNRRCAPRLSRASSA